MTEAVRRLGKYEIVGEVGKGGFATVYRARDLDLGREVALKVLDPLLTRDPLWVARFRREARAAAMLDHPHIVTIHEIGQSEGALFIAMKLVEGGSLSQRLAQSGPLSWGETVRMVSEIADALDFAHSQGVLHRDLKPANVLLDSRTGALLTDFGFARLVADNSLSVSMSGGIVGTPATMAPEVWEGADPTVQADVYALGCILYEMVTGEALFSGATPPAVMLAHFKPLALPDQWPEDTPPGLNEVLSTALDNDPAARYASAGDLAAAVAALSVDTLAEPYAALQAAVAAKQWQRALDIAGEIRARQPDYRDVAALEQQALAGIEQEARTQSAAQWRTSSEEALAAGDLVAAQLAIWQWRKIKPDDSELEGAQTRLGAEQASAATLAATGSGEQSADRLLLETTNPSPVVPPKTPAYTGRPSSHGRSAWRLLAVGVLVVFALLVMILRSYYGQTGPEQVIIPTAPTSLATLLLTDTPDMPSTTPTTRPGNLTTSHVTETASRPLSETAFAPPAPITVTEVISGPTGLITVTRVIEPPEAGVVSTSTVTPNPSTTLGITSMMTSTVDGMVMMYVPASEFLMGSSHSDLTVESDEIPQHRGLLDAFWIDRTEVTNAQYRRCVEAGKCQEPNNSDSYGESWEQDYPVVWVSWNDASDYCRWAGRRLPIEAEWEHAARGSDGSLYPWGNSIASCFKANYKGCVGGSATVGTRPDGASPFGALDMAGNVWEWVADWYASDYYSNSPLKDPRGPNSGQYRVLRGGSWNSSSLQVRAANRAGSSPLNHRLNIGFRCARSP